MEASVIVLSRCMAESEHSNITILSELCQVYFVIDHQEASFASFLRATRAVQPVTAAGPWYSLLTYLICILTIVLRMPFCYNIPVMRAVRGALGYARIQYINRKRRK